MFKTILNSYNIMLKSSYLLLAPCCSPLRHHQKVTSEETVLSELGKFSNRPSLRSSEKKKRLSRTFPYYHNSTSAQRIMLSGDIELNPGHENSKKYCKDRSQRKPSQALICKTCNKTIRTNTKRLSSIYCKNEANLLCSNSYNIKIMDSKTPVILTCSKCYFRELPFGSPRGIEDLNENTDLPYSATHYVNVHTDKLKEYHKHLRIAHLNTRQWVQPSMNFRSWLRKTSLILLL